MPLYHFSEDPEIGTFVPRAPRNHPDAKPMVWAIDDWHSPLYFFPANCPRVCFWPLATTTPEDLERHWPEANPRMVIAIEEKWLPALTETRIIRYELPEESFIDCEDHGVFVADSEVTPKAVVHIGPSLQALSEAQVELRVLPSLVEIARRVMTTTLHWSLIRMRFAAGWEHAAGTPTMPAEHREPPIR